MARPTILYTCLNLTAAVVSAVLAALPLAGQSGAFVPLVPLFDGTLDGWTIQNTEAGNFSIRDGAIRVEGPSGWLRSENRYSDFLLRVEFRFLTDDADSGIYVRAIGETEFMRGWPNESYQVQVRNPVTPSRLPPVGGLFRHGMPAGELDFDPSAVESAVASTGDWQTLRIQVVGEDLTVWLNDVQVMSASNVLNSPGYIGLQGEVGIVEYRSIDIRDAP